MFHFFFFFEYNVRCLKKIFFSKICTLFCIVLSKSVLFHLLCVLILFYLCEKVILKSRILANEFISTLTIGKHTHTHTHGYTYTITMNHLSSWRFLHSSAVITQKSLISQPHIQHVDIPRNSSVLYHRRVYSFLLFCFCVVFYKYIYIFSFIKHHEKKSGKRK